MKKEIIKKHLDKIESFLYHNYDVEVDYSQDNRDAYYECSDRREINSRQNFQSRLHSLLHEAGHVVLRCGGFSGERTFNNRFPGMKKSLRDKRYNIEHRIDVMREEVLAWEAAEKLAYQLSIPLDKKMWARHRSQAIKSYVDWVI